LRERRAGPYKLQLVGETKAVAGVNKAQTQLLGPPLLGTALAFGGAALSGVLYWAAFAGMDLWPFAFVAFGPLWIAMRGQTPKRALQLGWLAGTTMNVLGFYWLLVMLQTFSGFPTWACCFFLLVVCAYQGLRVGVMGWLYARAAARGWPAVPMFFAAFVASELAYPLLFPWYFAATMHKVPALMQVAELGGPILVGLVLLAANIALAEPLMARLEKRKVNQQRIAVCALAVGFALLYGVLRIPRIDARVALAAPVKVGVVQGNMGLLAKREDPGEGLRRHLQKSAELRAQGADFVVWSESSVTMPMREELAPGMLKRNVGSHLGLPAIFGAVLYDRKAKRELWYNVAVSTDRQGTMNARYDKEYLLQFGEHLPFSETFPILNEWSPNSGRFTPGTKLDPLVIDLTNVGAGADEDPGAKHNVAVLICYEDIVPAFTNAIVRATSPELLVNITNDAWFGATTEPWEHLALAQLRAVEHRKFLVRSTNSGVSAVVDPVGRLVANTEVRDVQAGSYKEADSLLATVRWMHDGTATIYEIVGDSVWWVVTALALACAFVRKRTQPVST
jgi:apolipoprotein N-acyltransferase